MAEAAKRATSRTTLVIERVEVPIGLFATTDKPGKLAEFTTGGPNGGVLEADTSAAVKPLSSEEPIPETPDTRDPLGDDPGSEAPPVSEGSMPASRGGDTPSTAPGEFKRYLIEHGTGQHVTPEEVRRGVRLDDGSFVDCTSQLAAIEEVTKLETMRVVGFVDVGQVERARILGSYYIGAGETEAAKPLRLIYEALRITRRAAVVRWTTKSRQSLGVLVAHGNSKTLVALKLAWAEDWREPPAKAVSVARSHVTDDELRMACQLVQAMPVRAADTLDAFRDEAIVMREELYAQALAGEVEPAQVPQPEPEAEGIAQFEASLAELLAPAGKG